MIDRMCRACGNTLKLDKENNIPKRIKYFPFCGKKYEVPQEVKDAVKTLKKYCNDHQYCDTCYFKTPYGGCSFKLGFAPLYWGLLEY